MHSDMLAVPNDDSELNDVTNDRIVVFGMKLLLANFMTEDEDTLYMLYINPLL